jgi:hypothetical protein
VKASRLTAIKFGLASSGRKEDFRKEAAGRKFPNPVVGADDDVRALTRGRSGHKLVPDLTEWDLHYINGNPRFLGVGLADLPENGGAGIIRPNQDLPRRGRKGQTRHQEQPD